MTSNADCDSSFARAVLDVLIAILMGCAFAGGLLALGSSPRVVVAVGLLVPPTYYLGQWLRRRRRKRVTRDGSIP